MQKSEIQHRPRNPLQHPQKLIIEIHQRCMDREPRFLNVVAKYMAVEMRFCTDRCGYGIFILIFNPLCNVRGRPSI